MGSKIVIFADLHYGSNKENQSGKTGINTFGHIKEEIIELKKKIDNINLEFIVNLGDVVNSQSEKEDKKNYREFIDIFNDNIYHVYGNHDTKNIEINELELLTGQGARYSFLHSGIRHVFLDAIRDDVVILSDETFSWLKNMLNNQGEKIVIYTHFPITLDEENVSYYQKGRYDLCFIKRSKELLDLINGSNCIAVISGHTHFYYNKVIDGIHHITIPSFSEDRDGKPALEYAILDYETMEIEIKTIDEGGERR